jgi:exosortase
MKMISILAAKTTQSGWCRQDMPARPRRYALLVPLCVLGWLWFTLINHLRVEWSVNPQYAYGWAVPFLCLYLLWRRVAQASPPASSASIPAGAPTNSPLQSSGLKEQGSALNSPLPLRLARGEGQGEVSDSAVSGHVVLWSIALCAFLYLPTRLIQEANPEWRLVSWALAFEVIGLTLLFIRVALGAGRLAQTAFAICFFLVAVPWPTVIEGPLIQGLMRANVGVTIELLGAIGIPAVQHGNVIEVVTGMVGIDDACSGIRSLQAALMLSLLFGELYALSARRRALCVLAGFVLSFIFNVGRTLLLTQVAAAKGVGAVASWHDPAGVTILVACFLSLWLLVLRIKRRAGVPPVSSTVGQAPSPADIASIPAGKSPGSPPPGSELDVRCSKFDVRTAFQRLSLCLIAWLLAVELGTELWYRSHEWHVPKTSAWHPEFPRDNPTFRDVPFSDKTKQFLRYDEGCNGTWQQGSEQRWQAIFFRWNPGRIALHLAKSHTPEVCLTAAGRELVSQSGLRDVAVHGLQLPFRSYVVKDETGPLHVYYCLWEDRTSAQSFRTTRMNYVNRLAPVLAGRRNSGQRSLEVAIWGIDDHQEAEAALARELGKLIQIEKPTDHR